MCKGRLSVSISPYFFNSLFTQVLLLVLSLVAITVILVEFRYLQFVRGYIGKTLYNSFRDKSCHGIGWVAKKLEAKLPVLMTFPYNYVMRLYEFIREI